MPSDPDIADHMLGELAELSLAVARDVQARIAEAGSVDDTCRLANAFARVSRCVRLTIALGMRLRRGEPLAPTARDAADAEPEVEREETFDEERPERSERLDIYEPLFDRLPPGDLPSQIAAVAGSLGRAAAVLPEPQARAYRARCAAITGERRPLPLRPANAAPPADPRPNLLRSTAPVIDLPRPRGPPRGPG